MVLKFRPNKLVLNSLSNRFVIGFRNVNGIENLKWISKFRRKMYKLQKLIASRLNVKLQ